MKIKFLIYEDRWNIEVFFKYLKTNFKLRNLKEKKKEDNDKLLTCQMIIIYISQLLKKYFIVDFFKTGMVNYIYFSLF